MIATVDFAATVPHTEGDLEGLQAYLAQLVGERFLFARGSYGDELTLHFGRERAMRPFRGLTLTGGTHVLVTRASQWAVRSTPWDAILTDEAASLDDLEARPPVTPGADVVRVFIQAFHGDGWPGGIELQLTFSDGSLIQVRPRHDPDDTLNDLADWELFTPYKRYVKAGPGVVWEYSPSDQPAA